jgi:predicted nucleic acid-binding protein
MKFVDTSFWFELAAQRGTRNSEARAIFERAVESGRIVTTNHVVGETWTLLRRRASHRASVAFLDLLGALPDAEIVHVHETEEDDAWNWLRRHDERVYSFVDATSFVIMKRRRIREALAYDGDFAAAGFVEVR